MLDHNLSLELRPEISPVETHRKLAVIESAVMELLRNMPQSRRPLPDWVKDLHVQVILERRSGYCPCCHQVQVAALQGRLEGSEFDHWYGRHRNGPEETWLVCAPCNRQLEDPAFKSAMRCCFESYQVALDASRNHTQGSLFR